MLLPAVTLAAWLAPADDEVAKDRATIEWIAPDVCPTDADVDALAERLLLAADGTIAARAEIVAHAGRFALALTIDGEARTFEADECAALAQLTALLVALAADPLAVAQQAVPLAVAPPPVRVPSPEPPAATLVTSPPIERREDDRIAPADPRTTTRASAGQGWIGVHAIAGLAQLPGLDAGLGIAAAYGRRRFAIELRASWLSPRSVAIPGFDRATATMTAVDVSPRACGVLGRRALRAALCGGPELGAVIARAHDVREPDTTTSLWLALVAAPGVHWYVHRRVALQLGADLVLALVPPRFALRDDAARTVGTGRGGLRAWAGLAVRFGDR